MFGKKKPGKAEPKKQKQTVDGVPPASLVVTCTNGCTKLECASLYEAQVFQKRMQRCPQCGGDLVINRFGEE